jgi:hypothetical protein
MFDLLTRRERPLAMMPSAKRVQPITAAALFSICHPPISLRA